MIPIKTISINQIPNSLIMYIFFFFFFFFKTFAA